MRIVSKLCRAAAATLLLSGTLLMAAAPTRVVHGRVARATGAAVEGAAVTATCDDASFQAVTNADGSFSLELPDGACRLLVRRDGFEDGATELHVAADTASVAVLLIPRSAFVEAVTVEAAADRTGQAPSTATKSDTPIAKTPQSITVVPAELIEETGAQGVQDALNYAAGVRSDAFGLDSRTDSVLVRGGYPDEYLDGLRQNFNYYTSTTRTDPYLLEKIEVLRGPASMLYGQGTTAGIVNLVSKRPTLVPQREVVLQAGSWGRLQLQGDFSGPIDKDGRWLYRVVALDRDADTQVDHVRDDRALVAPSVTWAPSEATSLTLQLRWQRDRTGSTLQFFPWEGTVLTNPNGPIPTSTFIGEPGFDRYDSERTTAGLLFEHRFGQRWTFGQAIRFASNDVEYRSLYSDSFSDPGNSYLDPEQRRLGRYAWLSDTDVTMWNADQHLEGNFETGRVRHRVLMGLDALRFDQTGSSAFDYPEHQGGGVPSIDVYAPAPSGYIAPAMTPDSSSDQEQLGIYVQDQMRFGERWIALAGVRQDWSRSDLEGASRESDDATTKRLGGMYVSKSGVSPYASYSESFQPLPGTDVYGVRFDPLRGKQLEGGVKFENQARSLYAAAALFDLREDNRLVADPSNPINSIQAGSTKTQGAELEFLGRFHGGLQLNAHYNWLDNDPQLDGVPEHQAAAWASRGVGRIGGGVVTLGLGIRWFSAFTDGSAPRVPAVALGDAMVRWEAKRWLVALNGNNVTDETYSSTCLPRGDCFYGARRTFSVSAGVRY